MADTPEATDKMMGEGREEAPPYTSEPPPSYSMSARMKAAKESSPTPIHYAGKMVMLIFCGTVCSAIWLVISFAIPIACIIVGAVYLKDCPCERFIPIYLVVAGAFGLLRAGISLISTIRKSCGKKDDEAKNEPDLNPKNMAKSNPLDGLVSCFLLAWFIAGSVWVYSTHGEYQSDDETLDNYCNKTVYLFAFWVITAQYILLGLILLGCCGICLCACCTFCLASAAN